MCMYTHAPLLHPPLMMYAFVFADPLFWIETKASNVLV